MAAFKTPPIQREFRDLIPRHNRRKVALMDKLKVRPLTPLTGY